MSFAIWPQEHMDALKSHVDAGCSFAVAAREINQKFHTAYTRNAAIGKAQRMGLCQPAFKRRRPSDTERTRRPPPPPRPKPNPVFAPPPRPKREAIELRCAEVEPRHVMLADLAPGECRYPYGDRNLTFCGHAAAVGASYCCDHLWLCTKAEHGNMGQERHHQSVRLRKRLPSPIALANAWEQA